MVPCVFLCRLKDIYDCIQGLWGSEHLQQLGCGTLRLHFGGTLDVEEVNICILMEMCTYIYIYALPPKTHSFQDFTTKRSVSCRFFQISRFPGFFRLTFQISRFF